MSTAITTARSVIERSVAEVFAFLANAANWLAWAIVNVKAIELTDDPDWWLTTTPTAPPSSASAEAPNSESSATTTSRTRHPSPGWRAASPPRHTRNQYQGAQ
ncbi:hypothetical protein [Streptomyces sp. NRRL F-2664]|uniref:hypothetical protein n=1 Tax=Streptomyces sp. NRRL F-2664 TaxID=1463842 RepID=UPI0004CAC08C|nr:hypothetical protein [Streptomyces sp. NRRL F-2664]